MCEFRGLNNVTLIEVFCCSSVTALRKLPRSQLALTIKHQLLASPPVFTVFDWAAYTFAADASQSIAGTELLSRTQDSCVMLEPGPQLLHLHKLNVCKPSVHYSQQMQLRVV